MNNELLTQYYKNEMLSIKENTSHGWAIHAKPIMLLSIINNIEEHKIDTNKIIFDDELCSTYYFLYSQYTSKGSYTSPIYPFYYLRNDGFMSLKLTNESVHLRRTPSRKYLQENVQYASFDNALWDLLQDAESREYLKQSIINYFFKSNE